MARIRSVHPSLFTDEAWVSCSPLARVLYIGLLTDADDQGLFEWKPLQIKMRLLPGDNSDASALLAELVDANLIGSLESAGKKLGAIRRFCKFQRPKKPNAVFVLPPEWRTYVGLTGDGSEPEASDDGASSELPPPQPPSVPPKSELAQQMEDGGWRMEGEPPFPEHPNRTQPQLSGETAAPRNGTRLARDWKPEAAELEYALGEGFSLAEIRRMGEDFRDFWAAKAGQDGCKLDWLATWRRWVRTQRDRGGKRGPPSEKRVGFV